MSLLPLRERAPLPPRTRTSAWLLMLALITGAATGVAGVGLLTLLRLVEHLAWGGVPGSTFAAASPIRRIGALLIAGVVTTIVRLALHRARAAPGGVLVTLWEQAGMASLGKTLARSVLSAVDVGLGAALGREGPLKDIGAAISARVAVVAGLGLGHRRLLVACGTAAGMAAAYNVPLGGALFGLEVLLGRIEIELVGPVIVCCATATTFSRWALGNQPTYHIPPYQLGGPVVFACALLFGALLGPVAALVLKGLRWFDTVEARSARLAPFMPLLVLGTLGVASAWLPQLLGNGYDAANAALHGELELSLLATLPVLRFGATAACTAAQVPGGLFTPVLSIGALIGGLIGCGVSHVWPGTPPGVFALLGMGALLAGASRGPISSVVLLAELSSDYQLILALACACGAATLVSRSLEQGSLYRLGPRCRPAAFSPPGTHFPLHPTRKVPALSCAADLLTELVTVDPRPLFVIDACGGLEGELHPETARRRLSADPLPRLLIVHDLVDRECPRLSVRASRVEARALFVGHDALRFVPVVDDDGSLLGEACREDFTDG